MASIFVYEYFSGGQAAFAPSAASGDTRSLLCEGLAMTFALASDFASLDNTQVELLLDSRLLETPRLPGLSIAPESRSQLDKLRARSNVRLTPVGSVAEHRAAFASAARRATWSCLIAPEFDQLLASLHDEALRCDGRILGCSAPLLALAADKHQLAEHLLAAGIAAPRGVRLAPEQLASLQPHAAQSATPAIGAPGVLQHRVLKPCTGAGSQGIYWLRAGEPLPAELLSPRAADSCTTRQTTDYRLEEFCPGTAASVLLLADGVRRLALPAVTQSLSADGRFTYQGGMLPLSTEQDQRARRLALQAYDTLGSGARGFIGVDLVLDDSPAQRDTVIEINPRLTTSYVGLRRATDANLAGALLALTRGEAPRLVFSRSATFTADGTCRTAPCELYFATTELAATAQQPEVTCAR